MNNLYQNIAQQMGQAPQPTQQGAIQPSAGVMQQPAQPTQQPSSQPSQMGQAPTQQSNNLAMLLQQMFNQQHMQITGKPAPDYSGAVNAISKYAGKQIQLPQTQ